MPSMKTIKRRIASVDTTKKIMKAMDMVAAAKLQKVKAWLQSARAFAQEAQGMLTALEDCYQVRDSVFFKPREVRRAAYVVITSDRGLCGSHNVNLTQKVLSQIGEDGNERMIVVGLKGHEFFAARGKHILRTYPDVSETVLYPDAARVAEYARALYVAGEVDEVHLAYTEFETVLTHVPRIVKLLPASIRAGEPAEAGRPAGMAYEPDVQSFLTHAIPLALNAFVYAALVESSACEQAARMMSMESAVSNASDIITKLTRTYNRRRQAVITQEISEIVSSANLMK